MKAILYDTGKALPGAVVHGISGDFKGKCSVYLDEAGHAVDMEQVFDSGNTRQVKKHANMWCHCEKLAQLAYFCELKKGIQ